MTILLIRVVAAAGETLVGPREVQLAGVMPWSLRAVAAAGVTLLGPREVQLVRVIAVMLRAVMGQWAVEA